MRKLAAFLSTLTICIKTLFLLSFFMFSTFTMATNLTSNEESILRLHLRHEFFQKVASYCSKQFPAQAAENSKSLSAWKTSNQSKLEAAAALMLKSASQGVDIDFDGLINLEKAQTKTWQVTKLGIPDNRAPLADECAKMMGNLAKVD